MIPDELNLFDDLNEYEDENDIIHDSDEIYCDLESPEDALDSPREDKIFNNKYNTGDGLTDPDEYFFSKKISVSNDYSDAYLKDIYEYEENLEIKFILDSIFHFLQVDPIVSKILRKSSIDSQFSKIKLLREEINFIFYRVNANLELTPEVSLFYSPIYILEALSSISSLEYKKLFDSLDTEIQEMLLLELNKKYKFLDGKLHKKRIH